MPVNSATYHGNFMLRKAGRTLAILTAFLCMALDIHAADIVVGSSGRSTRIVVYLQTADDIVPDIEQRNQTLIVKFPYTVAQPQTIHDRFLVQELTFDGSTAIITAKRPFSYTTALKEMPSRLVIDLRDPPGRDERPPFPVTRIETSFDTDGARVVVILSEGVSPHLRSSRSNKLFLYLPAVAPGPEAEKILSASPLLDFGGLMRVQGATAAAFAPDPYFRLAWTKYDRSLNAIVLKLVPRGKGAREERRRLIRKLYGLSEYAGVVRMLSGAGRNLDVGEKVILARSLWALSYPYTAGEKTMEALALMEQVAMDAGPADDPEHLMLEYCSMLVATGRPGDALRTLKELEGSKDAGTRVEASILTIASLNATGAYQDAYTAIRRIATDSASTGIPAALGARLAAVSGDTYLGLNDYAKAVERYRDALALDADMPRNDPSILGRMGEALFKANDFERARDWLIDAVNLVPLQQKPHILIMLGDSLYELGEKDRAVVAFSHAEELSPQATTAQIARLKRARIVIEKNTDERGRLSDRGFTEVMDIYDGIALSSRDQKDESLQSLVKVRKANAYARHGDWEKALATYLDAWRGSKKDSDVHTYARVEAVRLMMSTCRRLRQDNRYDRIVDIYTAYKDSFVKELADGSTQFVMGEALYRAGRIEEARKMLELSTRSGSAYNEQAFPLLFAIDYRQERFQEALLWNTIYLSTYPGGSDTPRMRHFRGAVLHRLGSLEAAIPFLEETSSADNPFALESLRILAEIHHAMGNTVQEQRTLDRIISFHPARVSPVVEKALSLRADRLRQEGDLVRARDLYRALLDTYPRSMYAHWSMYSLAHIDRDLGDLQEARELLTRVKNASRDPVIVNAARVALDDLELEMQIRKYDATRGAQVRN